MYVYGAEDETLPYTFYALPKRTTSARPDHEAGSETWIRAVCHLLVEELTIEGLFEACETLKDIYVFHQELAELPALAVDASAEEPVPVIVREAYTRPRLQVTEA